MIKKLQKKFISITAIALFIMIFLVMAAINCVFFLQTDRQLDIRLDMLFREQNSVRLQGNTPPPGEKEPEQLFPRFEDKLRIRSDGCVVYLNTSGNITEIRQDGAGNYSEEELESIVSELTAESDSDGWYQYYKFRMVSQTDSKNQSVTIIGLINASSSLYSVFTMLLISLCIGLISFLSILLIIVLASKHAVKPIAESYAKQKQFVTDAGHELKTPLTVISANNELARMIYGDSEWFDSIDRQVNKLNHLVRSLITLAKMDEEQKPVFTPFHFSDAVFDTAKSFESLLHSQGKLLTLDIAENITYNGDESKLRQMVSILMDNAVKYCDEKGKVAVKLTGDRQIRLQVINDYADTENFEADKVFERFFRADKARISDGSYGLGLSIAKSIVELHKGTIRAKVLEHGRIMFEVIL